MSDLATHQQERCTHASPPPGLVPLLWRLLLSMHAVCVGSPSTLDDALAGPVVAEGAALVLGAQALHHEQQVRESPVACKHSTPVRTDPPPSAHPHKGGSAGRQQEARPAGPWTSHECQDGRTDSVTGSLTVALGNPMAPWMVMLIRELYSHPFEPDSLRVPAQVVQRLV